MAMFNSYVSLWKGISPCHLLETKCSPQTDESFCSRGTSRWRDGRCSSQGTNFQDFFKLGMFHQLHGRFACVCVFVCSTYPLVNKQFAIENGPVEIVDLPSYKMVDFFRNYLYVYQAGYPKFMCQLGSSSFLVGNPYRMMRSWGLECHQSNNPGRHYWSLVITATKRCKTVKFCGKHDVFKSKKKWIINCQ